MLNVERADRLEAVAEVVSLVLAAPSGPEAEVSANADEELDFVVDAVRRRLGLVSPPPSFGPSPDETFVPRPRSEGKPAARSDAAATGKPQVEPAQDRADPGQDRADPGQDRADPGQDRADPAQDRGKRGPQDASKSPDSEVTDSLVDFIKPSSEDSTAESSESEGSTAERTQGTPRGQGATGSAPSSDSRGGDSFFVIEPRQREQRKPRPVSPPEKTTPDRDTKSATLVAELRKENERLRRELASAQRPRTSASAGTLESVLEMLDVRVQAFSAPPADLEASATTSFKTLNQYFQKTWENLNHVFKGLEISTKLPLFSERFSVAIQTGSGLEEYLTGLRYTWQAIAAGTWNQLGSWCKEQLSQPFAPETIEQQAKAQKSTPWDVYCDLFQKSDFYGNLYDRLRANVRAQLRKRPETQGFLL